jgi:hypothetical protein
MSNQDYEDEVLAGGIAIELTRAEGVKFDPNAYQKAIQKIEGEQQVSLRDVETGRVHIRGQWFVVRGANDVWSERNK